MRRRSENLLMIAAREPIPGFTKTRLGESLGMEVAAALYRAFLTDLAHRFVPPSLADEPPFDLAWAFTPAACDFPGVVRSLSPVMGVLSAMAEGRVRHVPQRGKDWGERQANLLRWGHEAGYRRTILTASDSPQMTMATVESAFTALGSHDVVLGRVEDGGYYLIGLGGPHDVLRDVPMSTASAADALVARARGSRLLVAEMEATFDVDTAADLAMLRDYAARFPAAIPATAAALARLVPAEAIAEHRPPR
ncbi:MAG: DUF2064 domain-containing protein [Thermomicrobiales bacterium]